MLLQDEDDGLGSSLINGDLAHLSLTDTVAVGTGSLHLNVPGDHADGTTLKVPTGPLREGKVCSSADRLTPELPTDMTDTTEEEGKYLDRVDIILIMLFLICDSVVPAI